MRTFNSATAALLLLLVPACEPKADSDDEGSTDSEGNTDGETTAESTLEEWIATCESQSSANDCEAVQPGTLDGEIVRCEQLTIVQTDVDSCLITVNDARCFAVTEGATAVPGYIHTDPDSQIWLIEAPQDTSVHGSTIEPCELADDGVTWMPEPLCDCAGETFDESGG
jgi:hypothetical protein